MMPPALLIEEHPGFAALTINRPPDNLLNLALLAELQRWLRESARRRDLGFVVLRSAGPRDFSLGLDLAEMVNQDGGDYARAICELCAAMLTAGVLTVAAVRGRCLGAGFEMVLAADVVLAQEDASFQLPEVEQGQAPVAAAILLPPLIGRARAQAVIALGRPLSAAEGYQLGLVNQIVVQNSLEGALSDLAQRVAGRSRAILREAKRLVLTGERAAVLELLTSAAETYRQAVAASRDQREGLAAAAEKRLPVWEHQ